MTKTQLSKLVKKACTGDKDAFTQLYSTYYGRVYATALTFLKNPHDAEDVAQNVFILVYEKLNTLDNPELFASWIIRITYNACAGFVRSQAPVIYDEDELLIVEDPDLSVNPLSHYLQDERLGIITDAIKVLSENHRKIITMKYFWGLRIWEIADILKISEGTVKSRLKYSRDYLRKSLYQKHQEGLFTTIPIGIGATFKTLPDTFVTSHAEKKLTEILGQSAHFKKRLSPKKILSTAEITVVVISTVFIGSTSFYAYGITNQSPPPTQALSNRGASPPLNDTTAPEVLSFSFSPSDNEFLVILSPDPSGIDPGSIHASTPNGQSVPLGAYDETDHSFTAPVLLENYHLYFADKAGNGGHALVKAE